MVFTLWAIVTIIFFMFRLIPADPASLLIDSSFTPEAKEQLRAYWGLDKPVLTQYFIYLGNLLQGDLGTSFFYRVPVMDVLGPFLLNSLVLMIPAVTLSTLLAVAIGGFLGWRRGSFLERWGLIIPLVLYSIPIYWLGLLALMVFAFGLRWLPASGMRELGYQADTILEVYLSADFVRHLILPMLTATLYFMASPLLLMRTSMIEVRHEDFLDVIRAKGVSEGTIIRHAMGNALLPVVTYLAFLSTIVVAGSVLLETVFAWPGMGRALVDSITALDYPLAQAAFFLWSGSVVVTYFLVDLLYYRLDPRISVR